MDYSTQSLKKRNVGRDVFADILASRSKPQYQLRVVDSFSKAFSDSSSILDTSTVKSKSALDGAKAEVAILPFGGTTADWIFARTEEERADLVQNLERKFFYINGTDIGSALMQGIRYLADPSFTERKIVLVTDGTTEFNAGLVKAKLAEIKVELHTVCIGPQNPQLEAISAHYDYLRDE